MNDAQTPETSTNPSVGNDPTGDTALRIRYRIRFAKSDLLRWISHRDLARLWERLLRRAELKLSMTEGFHPKPRIAFPSALALGVESFDEVVEIELSEQMSPQTLLERLQADHQPGLTIKSVCQLPEGFGKAQLQRSDYTITVVGGTSEEVLKSSMKRLLDQTEVSVERKRKSLTVKVADQIERLELQGDVVCLSLAASDGASLKPGDVLDLLGLSDWIERGTLIRRTDVVLKKELVEQDPAVMAVSPTWETELTEQSQRREA